MKKRGAINKEEIRRKSEATPGLVQRTFRTIRFERPKPEVRYTNGTDHDLLQDWDRHVVSPLRVRECICLFLWCSCIPDYILYYTILYYTILYYIILYYIILYYTILYYTILYYTTLHHTILPILVGSAGGSSESS